MYRDLSLAIWDDLNTSQKYDLFKEIYKDLIRDLIDFIEVSKRLNMSQKYSEELKKSLENL
jgi:hypothetical protein